MTDHIDNDDLPEGLFGDDGFDPSQVEDAGVSEEMQQAAKSAERVVLNMQHRGRVSETDKAEIYAETDLVKRAKLLVRLGASAIKFVHFTKANPNNPDDVGPRARKDSLLNRHAVYDALFDGGSGRVPFPHYDEFKGRLVDHEGNPFSTQTLRTRELVMALDAAGLENPTDKEVAESLRSWALDHSRDSLKDHLEKTIPAWDGTERLETALIKLFKPNDTPLNRLVGKYFWLSLYNRLAHPGCQAPITLALIGAQDIGKSYFSVLLCRILTGDIQTGPVKLDLGKDYNKFLRSITGRSIIANIGEMAGFKKGDINSIKDFVTRTEDDMDFKFADSMIKPRQWVTIMDGNGYEGLQRDETGNRRFYPMFTFQGPDKNGQPTWRGDEKVDFEGFTETLWQIIAECKAWMIEHGFDGYSSLISQANREVQAFSMGEMSKARGVMKDDLIENNLKTVIMGSIYKEISKGLFISSADINAAFMTLARREPFARSLAPHMRNLGFEAYQSVQRGWLYVGTDPDKAATELTEADLMKSVFVSGMDLDDPDRGNSGLMRQMIEEARNKLVAGGF